MRVFALVLSLALLASSVRAEEPSAVLYAQLVAKAGAGEPVDYTALRLSYARTDDYDPYGANSEAPFGEAWKAFQDKDCATALAKAATVLDRDFTAIPMHVVRRSCLEQAGDRAGAAREMAAAKGLAESLLASGDGRTLDTAFVIVTLGEERFMLAHFGLAQQGQALIGHAGKTYDEIDGVSKTGETGALYFDVTRLVEGMGRQLKKGP